MAQVLSASEQRLQEMDFIIRCEWLQINLNIKRREQMLKYLANCITICDLIK